MEGGLLDFFKTPEGQGLLAAGFGGLATANSKTPWNNIGRAGIAGLTGYSHALDKQVEMDKYNKAQADQLAYRNYLTSVANGTKQLNPAEAAANGMKPSDIQYFSPKVANYHTVMGADGRPSLVGFREDGTAVQTGQSPWQKPEIRDFGGNIGAIDPNTLKVTNIGAKSASPDAVLRWGNGGPDATVTNDPRAPWYGMGTGDANKMRMRLYDDENKKLANLRKAIENGRATMADLNRFGELNRGTATGGIYDKFAPTNWHNDPATQEMIAIQNRLGPMARPEGSGSTSNWEGLQYLSSLPGIDKGGDTNKNIRDDYARRFDQVQKELKFKEDYIAKYGHLNGSEEAYQDFTSKVDRLRADYQKTNGNLDGLDSVYKQFSDSYNKPLQQSQQPQQNGATGSWQVPAGVQQSRDATAGQLRVQEAGGIEQARSNLAQIDQQLNNKMLGKTQRDILTRERNMIVQGINAMQTRPTGGAKFLGFE